MSKIIALIIMLLFLGMTISSTTGINLEKQSTIATLDGNILYVGGSGPGNYSKIQDAINDSSDGDTVYVYDDSSPYYENIIVDKSINLIGEDRETTIIDGFENEKDEADVIIIYADGVTVQGFTIQNSFQPEHFWGDNTSFCGIEIWSDYNTIKNNIIQDNFYGIHIGSTRLYDTTKDYPDDNIIEENIILENGRGICILLGSNNLISDNFISSNKWGIDILFRGHNNLITLNNITLNEIGIKLNGAKNITIKQNTIIDNQLAGVQIEYSARIKVFENNILNNKKDASFYVMSFFSYGNG
ncbi:nitrous oxidase accessory protein [Thermoplasmatales archaeon SCGC AB-540-F20]|nr:nitrous oxidase accessory protein [Thermoplasmatales archaeon SCGC AB-540-F20]